jgi:hypothetical protein
MSIPPSSNPALEGWMGRLPRRSIKYEDRWNEWDTQDKNIEEPINK